MGVARKNGHGSERGNIETNKAEKKSADDGADECEQADLDRHPKPAEQQLALVPDEALPVAHRA
jgi:hypothetical protein